MWNSGSATHQAGVTLVELIVAMVIVGAAVAGLVAAFSSTARGSTDPAIRRQMMAIADGMMEEVLLKPFDAPAGAAPGAGRANFDNVADFDGFERQPVTDVNDDPIAALARYRVRVQVEPAVLRQVPAGEALRITVTVTHPGIEAVVLRGWRTRAQ